MLGLGYVGLPTGLALRDAGFDVLGIDISERRLDAIRDGTVDLLDRDRPRLTRALRSGRFALTSAAAAIASADAVLIAVPTPVDEARRPDPRALAAACAETVRHARAGQTIVLTSTTYVGTTRDLLARPLAERGLTPGSDVHVAFAPERINPGDPLYQQTAVPRVVGGVTRACADAAADVLAATASQLCVVSSPEAAELTKLHENTFRAVNLAFANELAAAARLYGVDPNEVIDAAATKPYGYLAHRPGPGVGGHCIPVDPYYLLTPLRAAGVPAPLTERALEAIAERPRAVAERAIAAIAARAAGDRGPAAVAERAPHAAAEPRRRPRVLLVGVAYKPGVADCRTSPAREIARRLGELGARVDYHDPLVPSCDGITRTSAPDAADYDLVLVTVKHPGHDYAYLDAAPNVVDAATI